MVDHLLADARQTHRASTIVPAPAAGTLLGEQVTTTAHDHLWRARLVPDAKPYRVAHRVRGVEVVPVSVLLQTLSAAAAQLGASTVGDVRFEYPIVADQPRVIHVVADGESADSVVELQAPTHPQQRWTRHVSARITEQLAADTPEGTDTSGAKTDPATTAPRSPNCSGRGASRASRSNGRSVALRPPPGGCAPRSTTAEAAESPTAALVDAAVHVARLADSGNAQLMLPAAVEGIRSAAELADTRGLRRGTSARRHQRRARRRRHVKTPDGTTCVDIRGLRYAAVESAPTQAAPDEILGPNRKHRLVA